MPPSLVADSHAIATKKLAASRSWVLLNARGQSVVLDVDKYAIMRRVGIHARDLRILDPLLSYPSAILGRERAIVLNLEHIKAIITAEEVFLRNPTDENVIPVVEELCRRLPMSHDEHGLGLVSNKSTEHKAIDPTRLRALSKSRSVGNRSAEHKAIELSRLRSLSKSRHAASKDQEEESSFEFRALEVALEAICSFLDARTMELEAAAYPALDELTSKISSRNLDRVRKLKAGMTRLTARVQKVRDELEQLLDDDGDMAELFLTRKQASSTSPAGGSLASNIMLASLTIGSRISRASAGTYGTENDVEELEMLLEAYFMQIDGTLNKLITLREYIDDTEDYINIQLDNHRNQLIQVFLA